MLPREHGAWAILVAPILVGLIAAPVLSPLAVALFCLGSLAVFLIRTPLQVLLAKPGDRQARGWLGLYAVLTLGAFVPLIVLLGCWKLLFFAVPAGLLLVQNLLMNKSGRRFSAFNEAAGVFGLCLGAPAAYYAASYHLDPRAWSLWLLCSAFFLGPIFHVKLAALQHRAVADKSALPAISRARRLSAAYHGLTLAAVAIWAAAGGVSALAAIPFAASLAKTLLRGAAAPARVDFKSLGYMEVGYTVLFVVMIGLAFAGRPAA
ncbi:MAG: YwiC-like family protein [Elusimicrobia bacterium]|nr:YwiC-like family protein [Elusimicrobiota bacterium]